MVKLLDYEFLRPGCFFDKKQSILDFLRTLKKRILFRFFTNHEYKNNADL